MTKKKVKDDGLTPYLRDQRKKFLKKMKTGDDNKNLETYISEKEGEIVVNWKKLIGDNDNFIRNSSEGVSNRKYNDILEYLKIKEVLPYEGTIGAYFLHGCGMDLSPRDGARIILHFTRKKDAKEYGKIKFADAMYNVSVCKNISEKVN